VDSNWRVCRRFGRVTFPMDNKIPIYPLTTRVLGHLYQRGFTPERKAIVLKVFGQVISHEASVDPGKLLARAEWFGLEESVEQLVDAVRLQEHSNRRASGDLK
jgi:hypothetical protein